MDLIDQYSREPDQTDLAVLDMWRRGLSRFLDRSPTQLTNLDA